MSNVKDVGNAALQVVIFYLLWFASCGLFILNIVTVLPALRIIAIAFGADQWTLPAVHRFSLLGLAVAAVIFFFWSEAGLSQSVQSRVGPLPARLRLCDRCPTCGGRNRISDSPHGTIESWNASG